MSSVGDGELSLAIFVGGGDSASEADRFTAGAESDIELIGRTARMLPGDFFEGVFEGEFSPLKSLCRAARWWQRDFRTRYTFEQYRHLSNKNLVLF